MIQNPVLNLFAIVFVAFTIFWCTSVLGSIYGWNTTRFVQVMLAFVLLGVRNIREIIRIVSGKVL